ncbi:hypothetical protein CEXT_244191 [Caerostris extrusa]|uniref:Uncharacterized protein n=1 Tax=Caerostris extrusa TaxID=172846 RepID=A0AAV4UVJ4_CAEEX|nr:hypothetical protein CEXT_244191 [Caerostris extrusa]
MEKKFKNRTSDAFTNPISNERTNERSKGYPGKAKSSATSQIRWLCECPVNDRRQIKFHISTPLVRERCNFSSFVAFNYRSSAFFLPSQSS